MRNEISACQQLAYLNCASLGPLCRSAQQTMHKWADQQADGGSKYWFEWFDRMYQSMPLAAKLINAQPEEIALTRSTSEGIKLVSEGFPWQVGDNVVFPANEFPANVYPWTYLANRGVEARPVPIPDGKLTAETLEPYIDSRTKIVSVSWVSYSTGWKADLKAIAQMVHSKGALLLVDAIQGLGAFPLDVVEADVDFLSAGAQKWLLSAQGSGLFYCKKSVNSRLKNINFGWASVENCTDFSSVNHPELQTAQRFMTGTVNTPAWLTMADSLELILKYGIDSISDNILRIRRYLIDQIQKFPIELGTDISVENEINHASGIVFFRLRENSVEKNALLQKKFVENGVELTCRNGGFRVSIHGFNNKADIDILLNILTSSL